jgi:hypothetical protein
MNHIIEVIHVERSSDILQYYVKLDKENYVIIDEHTNIKDFEKYEYTDSKTGEKRLFIVNENTGEVLDVHKYNLSENRSQNIEGLKKTMKNIRDLINNNFSGNSSELFITLTYRLMDGLPMSDIKKASRDFDVFMKRFRRKYSGLEYIAVLEPQANSAWHWHILCKFTKWTKKKHIRIDNNTVIYPMWGHGWTKTKAIIHVDNIGAYLSAYLASIEINEENKDEIFDAVFKSGRDIDIEEKEVTDDNGNKSIKKFVKGGRMHLYPTGTNIYRCSKGIVKPVSKMMSYAEAKKIIGKKAPDFKRSIIISENKEDNTEKDNSRVFNSVTYESYNLKRKRKK